MKGRLISAAKIRLCRSFFPINVEIYHSENLVSFLSHRYQIMKRHSNQRLQRCLEIMLTIISNGNSLF